MEVHILWIGRYFTLARPAKMFWLYLVLVLSAAVLVLVIVDCIILGFCDWAFALGRLHRISSPVGKRRVDHGQRWSQPSELLFDYEHEHRRKRLSTSTMNCLSQNGNGLGILPRKTLAGPAKPSRVARPEAVDLASIKNSLPLPYPFRLVFWLAIGVLFHRSYRPNTMRS